LENFYEILGVSETSTQDEIKKAFRTKSKVMHPDKGGNEEDFKKINEAYDTLGDENKRAQYDQQRNNPFGGGNPFDIFNDMFGGFNRQPERRVPDKVIDLNIGVVDSFLGKEMDVNFMRKTACTPCGGTGGEKETCNVCNGQGMITQKIGNSFFSNIVRTPCGKCSGRGFTFKNICHSCHGDGRTNEMMNLKINLPKGITDGQYIKAKSYGDYSNGMFGDTLFRINIISQNGFEKSGGDLIYNYYLTLEDINKDSIIVPYPTGDISLNLPKEIDTQKPLRVKGKGFESEGGDLYIKLNFKHTRL
jgi:molecular chaperone DnaJ